MAKESILYLNTEVPCKQALEILREEMEVQAPIETYIFEGQSEYAISEGWPGFIVSCFRPRTSQREQFEKDFNLTPDIAISFSLYSEFFDRPEARSVLVSAIGVLLRRIPGDALFFHIYEYCMLMRKSNFIIIEEETELWGLASLLKLDYQASDLSHIC